MGVGCCSCRSWKISWSTSFRNERRSAQKQPPEIGHGLFSYGKWSDEPADLGWFRLHGFQTNRIWLDKIPRKWPKPSICFPLPGCINTRHNRWANLGSEPCHLLVAAGTSTGGYSWPMRRIVRTFPICLMWSAYACLPVLWQGLLGFCENHLLWKVGEIISNLHDALDEAFFATYSRFNFLNFYARQGKRVVETLLLCNFKVWPSNKSGHSQAPESAT